MLFWKEEHNATKISTVFVGNLQVPGSNGMDRVKDIPVFLSGSPTPAFWLSRDQARELVDYGRAKWRRHCRAILLLSVFDTRGFSCRFEPDATLTASAEKRAAVHAWAGCGLGGEE
jgi:hypothetical protein